MARHRRDSRQRTGACARHTRSSTPSADSASTDITADEPAECIAGEVLQGHKKPHDCPAFGVHCTPERPLGAPMVSTEGACAAYYRYRRTEGQGMQG